MQPMQEKRMLLILASLWLSAFPCSASEAEIAELATQGLQQQAKGNYLQAETLMQNAINMAHRENQNYAESLGLAQLARLYGTQHKFEQALEKYQESLNLAETLTNVSATQKNILLADCFSGMADSVMRGGNYPLAEKYLNKALTMSRGNSAGDISWTIGSLITLSNIYTNQHKFQAAIDTCNKAFGLLPSVKREYPKDALEMECHIKQVLAHCYSETGNLAEAEKNALSALELSQSDPLLRPDISSSCRVLGKAYYEKGNLSAARTWLLKALKFDEEFQGKDDVFVAMDLDTLGIVSAQSGNLAQAKAEFEKAKGIVERNKNVDTNFKKLIDEHLRMIPPTAPIKTK